MRTTSVLRVGAVLGALVLCGLVAAERRSPLIGSTREQVRARLGEPKSNIVAGAREVLIYPQERIVLRDGVVVEVDALYELSAPKATVPAPTASAAAEGTGAAVPGSPPVANRDETSRPQPNGAEAAPAGQAAAPDVSAAGEASPAPAAGPEVFIKSVRPPSRSGAAAVSTRPLTSTAATPVAQPTTGERSPPATQKPKDEGSPATPLAGVSAAASNTPPATVPAPVVTSVPVTPPALAVATANEEPADAKAPAADAPGPTPASAAVETPTPAAVPATPPPAMGQTAPAAEPSDEPVNRRPYILGGIALVLVGLLAWVFRQRRQRSLLLEASAVSHPPFATMPLTHASSSRFNLDLLQKLEWKRFEELVCAYYNKTGVLAVRTKTGRQNPVHVRISWKGEQRPFACVHCIAHAPMAVDQRPIEALHGALAIEDVRRGYVVTSGKFAPAARETAEEKQITLLSGDVFIEKLNALPDAARAELLKDVMTGDYSTPSCPTCEAKMAKSVADPLVWECTQCGTTMR